MTTEISIGRVKRDISEPVNRVAYQGERIILTSRGRPKAVLVSLQDYEKLQQAEKTQLTRSEWLTEAQALAKRISDRRGKQEIDVNALIDDDRVWSDNR
jgi:prevent-host-death family protein